jgi:hypothetical protein
LVIEIAIAYSTVRVGERTEIDTCTLEEMITSNLETSFQPLHSLPSDRLTGFTSMFTSARSRSSMKGDDVGE